MSTRYLGGFITKSPTAPTTSAAPGIWTLDQALGYIKAGTWPVPAAPPSSQSYTTAGTYTWVAPAGVTSVSIVTVGGGQGGYGGYQQSGNGGEGGNLRYKNNFTVTPGNSYSVVVGVGGAGGPPATGARDGVPGGTSSFNSTSVLARGGYCFSSQSVFCGGSNGGCQGGSFCCTYRSGGGGGAGGYGSPTSGSGGAGGSSCSSGTAGSSGAGGGGASSTTPTNGAAGGGGVGIFGQGSSGGGGAVGASGAGGGGGSGGATGGTQSAGVGGAGGAYGGGGGGGRGDGCNAGNCKAGGAGGVGAVRIVWPGNTRQFPSTCVGAP